MEKAKALPVGESTLGSQALVFLQTLTELASHHPRSAMGSELVGSAVWPRRAVTKSFSSPWNIW